MQTIRKFDYYLLLSKDYNFKNIQKKAMLVQCYNYNVKPNIYCLGVVLDENIASRLKYIGYNVVYLDSNIGNILLCSESVSEILINKIEHSDIYYIKDAINLMARKGE